MEPFEREVVSDLDEHTDDRAETRRRIPLHVRILLGLVVGATLGSAARAMLGPDAPLLAWVVRHIAEPVGQLFLRSLLMTVVPLVVSSLIVGVAGIGDVRRLGRVGVRTVGFCLVISIVSVGLGILLANTVRPGTRLDPETRDLLMASTPTRRSRRPRRLASTNRRSCRLRARWCRRTRSSRWRDRRPTCSASCSSRSCSARR